MRIVIPEALKLIKIFEGLRLHSYVCPAGKLTIGYGHTGADVKKNMVISIEKANEIFEKDIQKFSLAVETLIHVPITDRQFGALVSFAYNVGIAAFGKSTLLKTVNAKKSEDAASQFLRWVYVGKDISKGLEKRRAAERELFVS